MLYQRSQSLAYMNSLARVPLIVSLSVFLELTEVVLLSPLGWGRRSNTRHEIKWQYPEFNTTPWGKHLQSFCSLNILKCSKISFTKACCISCVQYIFSVLLLPWCFYAVRNNLLTWKPNRFHTTTVLTGKASTQTEPESTIGCYVAIPFVLPRSCRANCIRCRWQLVTVYSAVQMQDCLLCVFASIKRMQVCRLNLHFHLMVCKCTHIM